MNSTILDAVAGKIQMHMDAIQKNKDAIEQLNASNLIEMKAIQDLETAREIFIKEMLCNAPTVQVVEKHIVPDEHAETLAEKLIVPTIQVIEKPTVQVKTVAVKTIAHAVPVETVDVKAIAPAVPSLLPDDYSSVNNKNRKLLSNDKKLTDTDFDIYQQFDAKCIHKEKVKAKYNLYYEGQLLHWINEKGEYSSTYTSGTNFTPFGPNNGDPFKASLFGRTNQKVKGWLFFGTQSNPTSAKTSAKNSEQTSEQTSEQISKIDMDNEKEFPSLEGK